MNKVLLIGRGQIGTALAENLTGFDLHIWPHDIDDLSSEALAVIHPDVVVNVAGKTDLAWCEANAREAVRSNLEAPVRLYGRILAHARSESPDIRYIHVSSGCIWDGPYDENGMPFTPNSPATPACLYSWTKAASDAMLLSMGTEHLAILRPRQVYSASTSRRNTLMKLMKYPKLVDTANSMSGMSVIQKTIAYVATATHEWTGVWNVYDRGIVTPYEVGVMLFEAGLREHPSIVSKSELDAFHKPRRVDTVLYDERFERLIEPGQAKDEIRSTIGALTESLRSAQVAAR